MAQVAVTIPRMLADLIDEPRSFELEASSVAAVLDELTRRHPQLAVHLFDEMGAVRQHVSVFHNERQAELASTTTDGDRVVILQAVSGG